MKESLFLVYGIFTYILGNVAFFYLIGFVGNLVVPGSIDAGTPAALGKAALVDVGLLSLFGLQHSLMARPTFKKAWTKIVPWPIERSTYVLLAAIALGLLFWQWRPLPAVVWEVQASWARWLLWGLFGLGWVVVYASAEMINSNHLFGLQQVRQYRRGEDLSEPEFQTPLFYRYVRHPLVLGFLIAFWATPQMTVGHLLFAAVMTGYVLVALRLEEHNLTARFGEKYRRYREQVPMLLPGLGAVAVVTKKEDRLEQGGSK